MPMLRKRCLRCCVWESVFFRGDYRIAYPFRGWSECGIRRALPWMSATERTSVVIYTLGRKLRQLCGTRYITRCHPVLWTDAPNRQWWRCGSAKGLCHSELQCGRLRKLKTLMNKHFCSWCANLSLSSILFPRQLNVHLKQDREESVAQLQKRSQCRYYHVQLVVRMRDCLQIYRFDRQISSPAPSLRLQRSWLKLDFATRCWCVCMYAGESQSSERCSPG